MKGFHHLFLVLQSGESNTGMGSSSSRSVTNNEVLSAASLSSQARLAPMPSSLLPPAESLKSLPSDANRLPPAVLNNSMNNIFTHTPHHQVCAFICLLNQFSQSCVLVDDKRLVESRCWYSIFFFPHKNCQNILSFQWPFEQFYWRELGNLITSSLSTLIWLILIQFFLTDGSWS